MASVKRIEYVHPMQPGVKYSEGSLNYLLNKPYVWDTDGTVVRIILNQESREIYMMVDFGDGKDMDVTLLTEDGVAKL